MMKRLLLLLTLMSCMAVASAAIGDWRVYAAYHNAQKVAVMGQTVYVMANNGLFSYDIDDTSTQTYDKASALSDNGIFTILPWEAGGELVIVYDNGNIDLLSADGDVYNLPDLKLKTLSDKTINDASVQGSTLYVSTGSGIVCVDLKKRLFGDFYNLGQSVNSVAVKGNLFYAATTGGVYMGNTDENLLDPSNWTKIQNYNFPLLAYYNGNVYALAKDGIFLARNEQFQITRKASGRFYSWQVTNGEFYAFNTSTVAKIDANGECTTQTNTQNISGMDYSGGTYWAACGDNGLQGLSSDFEVKVGTIAPNSPLRNYAYRLQMTDAGRLLVAGGAFNYPEVFYEGTVMAYENQTWTAFDEEGPIAEVGSNGYRNATDVVEDPSDNTHHFVSTVRSGLYEFKNGQMTNHYTCTNSPLQTILPNVSHPEYYVRVTGLSYDASGNLWMCTNEVDTIVHVLKKDGTWASFYFSEIAGYPTFDHIRFDQRGWAWMNSRRSTGGGHRAGILVYDPSSKAHTFINSFYNQDGTQYTPTEMNEICEDLDGNIWIGCERGLFVTYSPKTVFNSDFYFTQVKVPRNDGTNLADYLLSDVNIKCICVDGGNRKWIGTTDNGVYLVSADGLETIHHFTADDTPLLSDEIYDIAIDGQTGEVFFATSAGLISYMGDATEPESSLSESNVKVYPNPVRPEYAGNVVITGLMRDTNVKIVNAAGRLVHEGTSVGGEYTWDRTMQNGKKCATGIYYILAADSDGKKGVAAKMLVVNE